MDHSDIITTLRTEFAIDVASCRRLPGEVDLNTLVVAHDGQRYVLKVHSPDASIAELDMQDAALAHVSATGLLARCPRLIRRGLLETNEQQQVARLTWVDGRPLSASTPSPRVLHTIGQTVARTDLALSGFDHVATDRPYRWNMLQCAGLDARRTSGRQRHFGRSSTTRCPHTRRPPGPSQRRTADSRRAR